MQPNDSGIYYFLGNITSHILHALPLYEKLGGTFIVLSNKAKAEVEKYDVPVINIDNKPYIWRRFGWKFKPIHEYDTVSIGMKKTTDFLESNAKVVIFYELYEFDNRIKLNKPKTIFLTHGNMLKSYMNQNNRLRRLEQYDYMAALGPFMKNQFISSDGIEPVKLLDLGVARTDEIVKHKGQVVVRDSIRSELNIPTDSKIISYMPTFWGVSSIYDTGLEIVRNFPVSYTLIFRPHPQTPPKILKQYLQIIKSKPNVIYAPQGKYKNLGLVDIFEMSSAIIGDVSSVMLEAVLLEKPLIFAYGQNNSREQTENYKSISDVLEYSPKITIDNSMSIESIIKTAIKNGVDANIWRETAKRCFYSPDGNSTAKIAGFIKSIL